MPQIFISYSHEDNDYAHKLARYLVGFPFVPVTTRTPHNKHADWSWMAHIGLNCHKNLDFTPFVIPFRFFKNRFWHLNAF